LQQITLLTDSDNETEDNDVVKLMTIHAAKGLEFGCVFVVGVEETLFPSAMSINTREELEEERRLFYVAVTRAKQRLWLTYANARYRFGQLQQNEPSRFIDEMPEAQIDKTYSGGGIKNTGGFGNEGSAFQRMQRGFGFNSNDVIEAERKYGAAPAKKEKPAYLVPQSRNTTINHIPSNDFLASDTSNLQAGQKVEHQKFGFGNVTKVEGSAHNPIATIMFDKNGERKIMLNYAKLRIIE
jgi:DNA helicase-2/ATP-dependent DNA helicase PcrA